MHEIHVADIYTLAVGRDGLPKDRTVTKAVGAAALSSDPDTFKRLNIRSAYAAGIYVYETDIETFCSIMADLDDI